MKSLTINSRKQLHSSLRVMGDKPSVCGILFFMKKKCCNCGLKKEICEFSKLRDGFRARCKKCCDEWYKKVKVEPIENLPNEEWRDVVGYEGLYQVSNKGRLKTLGRDIKTKTGKAYRRQSHLYKQQDDCKRGYFKVMLNRNGHRSFFVHRLVAIAFIPNTENKRTVNHKDGVKTNNCVDNLEWATDSEQIKHSFDFLNREKPLLGKFGKDHHTSKKIVQLSLDNKEIKVWDSLIEVQRAGVAWSANISKCAKGEVKTAAGYKWKFKTGTD